MVLEEEAREFQETILRSVGQHTAPYAIRLKGIDYVLFPDTFNPHYAIASLFLLDNMGVKKGDIVLDPFTGCGVDAVFAVRGGAVQAVAIDKFTMPYLCTRYNVHRLGLEDQIDVRQGDLFDPLREDEQFSLVIANPPFKSMKPQSPLEASVRDEDYQTLRRFFDGVGNYLDQDGRMRIVFSDVGDRGFFQELIRRNDFTSETIAQKKYASQVMIEIYEVTRK